MAKKVLRLDLKQQQAHYRNPKFNQNDFIPSLKLPGKTTIMGFLTYILGRRINSEVQIAVIGEYKNKTIDFIRGEEIDFQKKYKNFQKGKDKFKYLMSPEYVQFYKENSSNTIMRQEILREVNLKIFVEVEDDKEFQAIKEALENPKNYMALGRKEDFLMPRKKGDLVEVVELEKFKSKDIRNLIKEGIKIKNTYIKVDLANPIYDSLLQKGELLSLASTYKDLEASKNNREYIMSNYIFLDSDGIYPKDLEVNIYRDKEEIEVFTWM